MKQVLPTFLDNIPSCKKVLENNHVLFDANVLISLNDDYNFSFLDYLQSINVVFTTIHPVLVELQATNNPQKRTERQTILTKYKFRILPLTKTEMDFARDIQTWLATKQCFPEPTDLYLAGTLAKYNKNILLATSNLSDFPFPLFTRPCHILLQNHKHANIVSFLQIDLNELAALQTIMKKK